MRAKQAGRLHWVEIWAQHEVMQKYEPLFMHEILFKFQCFSENYKKYLHTSQQKQEKLSDTKFYRVASDCRDVSENYVLNLTAVWNQVIRLNLLAITGAIEPLRLSL